MNFLSKSEIEKKITLTKGQKNQKNEDQIRKYIYIYIYHKFGLKDEIQNT
jgi:hypothetical protein